jgi:hypothetical protein
VVLCTNTLTVFLKSLDKEQLARVPDSIRPWHEREPDGWFGLGSSGQTIQLQELAQYLLIVFKKDGLGEPYALPVRLFNEQCDPVIASISAKPATMKIRQRSSPTMKCAVARSDIGKAPGVVDRLDAAGVKPDTLFADGGYPSVPSVPEVLEHDIEFMTPVNRSRLPDDVMRRDRFQFDGDACIVCPMGHHRILSANNSNRRSLHAIFDGITCRACVKLDTCPVRAPNHRSKGCHARDTVGDFRVEITAEIRLRDEMYALQQIVEWKDRYKFLSGIEATNSELKRAHGIGKLKVRRLPKVCFAVACKVIACTIKRWAKAATATVRPLPGYVVVRYSHVTCYWTDVIGTGSIYRQSTTWLFIRHW